MKRIWIEAVCLIGLLILFSGVGSLAASQGNSEPQQEGETAAEATGSQSEPEDEVQGAAAGVEPAEVDPGGDAEPDLADAVSIEAPDSVSEEAEEAVSRLPSENELEGPWVARVGELSKQILLGQASRADADALLGEVEPNLRAACNQLRQSLSEGASFATLQQQHAAMEDLYDARLLLLREIKKVNLVKIIGWGADGVRQAREELDRLQLHMRYQNTRLPEQGRTLWDNFRTSPVPFLKGLFYVVLVIMGFRLWRRWAGRALPDMRQKLINARPRTRRNLRLAKAIWYIDRLRAPLEWLLAIGLIASFLRPAFGLVDERPVFAVVKWVFIGWFGLSLVNSIAARGGAGLGKDGADLRLRSLKLIWGWIALFGLSLELADQFVGRGTIRSWVWWVVVFLGLPVLLVIIHWWRDEVIRRAEQESHLPAAIQRQVARSKNKRSYVATAVVGGYLIVRALQRRFLRLVSRFELGRRILAHVFRREVARQAEAQKQDDGSSAIPEELREQILASQRLVPKIYRSHLRQLIEVANEGGTISVVVGDRGIGKSTLLRRLGNELGDRMLCVDCPPGNFDQFLGAVSRQLGVGESTEPSLREFAQILENRGIDVLAIDNVHRLVRPAIGGMRDIDRLSELLDQLGRKISRIVTLDSAAWLFVRRARQDRLILDRVITLKPWGEKEIGDLLGGRSEVVGIEPDYEQLQLPRQLDEMVYEVERDRKRYGFYRILWDSSDGIPAVALRLWCESLRVGENGEIFVRIFSQPDIKELEELNLSARFVLRSVSQMEFATVEQIVDALRLSRRDVEVAVRFSLVQGYLEEEDGVLHITWPWYRSIRRLLARQNLLVTG